MEDDIATLMEQTEHPTLKRMLAMWQSKRAGRPVPLRADFDPTQMVFALGNLSLFDVEDNPRRFWCRLDGTRQAEFFGIDCTGKYLDECFAADYNELAYKSFSNAVETGTPNLYQRQLAYLGRLIRYEVLLLPISRRGDRIDMLLIAQVPHWT